MTVYVDVTYVLCVAFRSGIPRVVQEVLLRIMRGSFPPLTPVYFEASRNEYRFVHPERFLFALEFGKKVDGLVTDSVFTPDCIERGDVFFDIDAVWHLSPRRSVLYPQLKAAGARIVSYVYDIIPVTDPQFCEQNATTKFLHYLGAVLDNADLILASTESTMAEIDRLCDDLGVPRVPGRSTWLGADFKASATKSDDMSLVHPDAVRAVKAGRFVLMVGTIQPLKNQSVVLEAFEKRLFAKGVNLVLAGKIGWDVEALEKRIREHPLLGRQFFFLDRMNDATIDYLYRNAFCLAFATYREGFGLPTVEALQRGVPVLASDIPVLREVGGDFCRYFNPDSPDSFAETLEPLIESDEAYGSLRAKVASYRPVSWDAVSAKIAGILGEELVSSKARRFIFKARCAMRKMADRFSGDSALASAFAVRDGEWLSFAQADGAPALVHVLEGASHPEPGFTWTCGSKLVLAFQSNKGKSLSLALRYRTFLPNERIVARVEGREIASTTVSGEGETTFIVPSGRSFIKGVSIVTLDLPDATSPAEVLGSADTRRIALALLALKGSWLPKGDVP